MIKFELNLFNKSKLNLFTNHFNRLPNTVYSFWLNVWNGGRSRSLATPSPVAPKTQTISLLMK